MPGFKFSALPWACERFRQKRQSFERVFPVPELERVLCMSSSLRPMEDMRFSMKAGWLRMKS